MFYKLFCKLYSTHHLKPIQLTISYYQMDHIQFNFHSLRGGKITNFLQVKISNIIHLYSCFQPDHPISLCSLHIFSKFPTPTPYPTPNNGANYTNEELDTRVGFVLEHQVLQFWEFSFVEGWEFALVGGL